MGNIKFIHFLIKEQIVEEHQTNFIYNWAFFYTLAASMLIRNMLRVNPERRADIDEIASHWWLNLDENMPVIQELPENQVCFLEMLGGIYSADCFRTKLVLIKILNLDCRPYSFNGTSGDNGCAGSCRRIRCIHGLWPFKCLHKVFITLLCFLMWA